MIHIVLFDSARMTGANQAQDGVPIVDSLIQVFTRFLTFNIDVQVNKIKKDQLEPCFLIWVNFNCFIQTTLAKF